MWMSFCIPLVGTSCVSPRRAGPVGGSCGACSWAERFPGQRPTSSIHLCWKPAAKCDCGTCRSILARLPLVPATVRREGCVLVAGGKSWAVRCLKAARNGKKRNPLMRAAGGKTLSLALRFLTERALCLGDNPRQDLL